MTTLLRGPNFLLSPGPTHVPDRVLRAMNRPAVELGTPEFLDTVRGCFDGLARVFQTERGEVFMYAANGHGAWEAALANVASPGSRFLVPGTGHFSDGWSKMARDLGAEVTLTDTDWRHALDPQAVEDALRADTAGEIAGVLAIHSDTATGTTSDIRAVRQAMDAAGHDALLLVDAVASLGCTDLPMDAWGIDVVVAASQKGLMGPPGLGIVAASPKALEVSERARIPRSYWDWTRRRRSAAYTWFCGTAPEHLVFGLAEALTMIEEEGLAAIFARHRRLGGAVRAAVEHWSGAGGVSFNVVDPAERSESVTTVLAPEGVEASTLNDLCRDRFNVAIGRGLGVLKGRAFRISHMGDSNEPTVLGGLGAIEAAMLMLGWPVTAGGAGAAVDFLVDDARSNTPAIVPASAAR